MQILITRAKPVERRSPHLAAYRAVPHRLGGGGGGDISNKLKRNKLKSNGKKRLMGRE